LKKEKKKKNNSATTFGTGRYVIGLANG